MSEVLIPYYRALESTRSLIEAIWETSRDVGRIVILGFEDNDGIVLDSDENVVYIKSKIENVEKRLYKYLCEDCEESDVVVIHTDVEIVDYSPVDEIVQIGRSAGASMIGKMRKGGYLASYSGYINPCISSHFLYVNPIICSNSLRFALERADNPDPGFSGGESDIFPTRAFQHSALYGGICLELPKSIESKIVHYNSATRRSSENKGLLQNDLSLRDQQVTLCSGMMLIRKERPHLRKGMKYIIVGIGEDAVNTAKTLESYSKPRSIVLTELSPVVFSGMVGGYRVIPFGEAMERFRNNRERTRIYISVPNYEWWIRVMRCAGMQYYEDYIVQLRAGSDAVNNEYSTFYADENDEVSIDTGVGLRRPNNNFIDSPDKTRLSYRRVAAYAVTVFLYSLGKPLNWSYLIQRNGLRLKRLRMMVERKVKRRSGHVES